MGTLTSVVSESQLVSTEHGRVRPGQGWFILDARDAEWWDRKGRGALCEFEGAGFEGGTDFPQLGVNLTALGPGGPMAMYHRENDQEDFLVLARGGSRHRRRRGAPTATMGLSSLPPGTSHVIVGAGNGQCLVLAMGARDRSTGPDWGASTVDEAARRHGAGVERETTEAEEAYARFPKGGLARYREGWLPE